MHWDFHGSRAEVALEALGVAPCPAWFRRPAPDVLSSELEGVNGFACNGVNCYSTSSHRTGPDQNIHGMESYDLSESSIETLRVDSLLHVQSQPRNSNS